MTLFLPLTLCLLVCAAVYCQKSVENKARESSGKCHSDHFSCYDDCCKTGEMFCHDKDERCYSCETRSVLCGNDSLPRDCLLFCYKQQHPPNNHAEDAKICLDWTSVIAIAIGVPFVVTASVVAFCLLMRRRSFEELPWCIQKLLPEKLKDPDVQEDADTEDKELHPSSDATKPLLSDRSSSVSNSSRTSLDVSDLRVTTTESENTNGEQQANASDDPISQTQKTRNGYNTDATSSAKVMESPPEVSDSGTTRGGQDMDMATEPNTLSQASNRNGTPASRGLPSSANPTPAVLQQRQNQVSPASGPLGRPDFTMMNPTVHPTASEQRPVVAPGTKNPVGKFCTESPQSPISPRMSGQCAPSQI